MTDVKFYVADTVTPHPFVITGQTELVPVMNGDDLRKELAKVMGK